MVYWTNKMGWRECYYYLLFCISFSI